MFVLAKHGRPPGVLAQHPKGNSKLPWSLATGTLEAYKQATSLGGHSVPNTQVEIQANMPVKLVFDLDQALTSYATVPM